MTLTSKYLQYFAAASGNLALVTDGMHYGWPSPTLPQILKTNSTLSITEEEGALMSVMPLLGAVVGALVAAQIVDYFGRKKTILFTSVPFFFAWIMVAAANSPIYLFIARFIAGIADGVAFTVIPMYIGEIAEPKVRGLLGSSCSVSWILGFLLINLIGSYLSISATALTSSALCVVAIITFMWMPESPYYLLMKNNVEKAKANLLKFRSDAEDIDNEIQKMNISIQSSSRARGKFLDLFTVRSNRRAVIIVGGLRGFQQFSGNTAISFYAQRIFEEAGSKNSTKEASIIYFSIMFIMTILSSVIVDKAGRKPLLIVSMAGSIVALTIEGTFFYLKESTEIDSSQFEYVSLIGLILFVVMFSVGMQSIPICLLGELFPTSVKAYALCLADIYYSFVATIASKFLQYTMSNFGLAVAFYGFALSCILGLIFIIIVVPETKGRTLEEIQYYLKGETPYPEVEMEMTKVNGSNVDADGEKGQKEIDKLLNNGQKPIC